MKILITILLTLSALLLINFLLEERTDRIIKSSEEYEICIQKQYNMTPSYYYEINGEYPLCK